MRHRAYSFILPHRLLCVAALTLCGIAPAVAADGDAPSNAALDQVVADPTAVPIDRNDRGAGTPQLLQAGRMAPVSNHDSNLALNIRYTNGRIFNPATGRYDRARLRSYVAEGAPPNPFTPFVGPTIAIRPGKRFGSSSGVLTACATRNTCG